MGTGPAASRGIQDASHAVLCADAVAGRLERIYHAYYGWALPLAAGVERLEAMGPVQAEYVVDVRERAAFGPKPSSPAIYEWRTTYYSWRADDLRERIANEGLTAVAKTYLRQLQDVWPGVVAREPMRVEDDLEENRLTTTESYDIPAPWKHLEGGRVEFATKDYFIGADLADLPPGARRRDVHLGRPRITTRHVELELPVDWPSEGWDISIDTPGLKFETRLKKDKKRIFVLDQRLEVSRDTMPAADVARYSEVVAALRKGSDVVIHSPTAGDAFRKQGLRVNWWATLRYVVVAAGSAAATLAYCWFR